MSKLILIIYIKNNRINQINFTKSFKIENEFSYEVNKAYINADLWYPLIMQTHAHLWFSRKNGGLRMQNESYMLQVQKIDHFWGRKHFLTSSNPPRAKLGIFTGLMNVLQQEIQSVNSLVYDVIYSDGSSIVIPCFLKIVNQNNLKKYVKIKALCNFWPKNET